MPKTSTSEMPLPLQPPRLQAIHRKQRVPFPIEENMKGETGDFVDVPQELSNFAALAWTRFMPMYSTWNTGIPLLGGRKPLEFWNDSVRDYAVLAAEMTDSNDPVEQYQSTISRDQTNKMYANLASKFFYPSVIAQNNEQAIDRTLGKVGDSLLYWAFKQDGWPSESGQQKMSRLVHKCCVEGTAYTLDIVTEDGLESELVPNEEVFYPNMWQPNLQLQSRVYRVRLNMTKGEAEEIWGGEENWKYVDTSNGWTSSFVIEYPELKGIFDGIVQDDRVSVMHTWERATQKQLAELKRKRKVHKDAKRAWFYNVVVNNTPMLPLDTVSPYKSGILPISKMIFEPMAKTEFCLGNSVPNKCQEDKRWKDAWKTNIRWRGKLAGMPPQLVIGGYLNTDEVMIPAQFTSIPRDVEVKPVAGVMPITNTDVQLMQMADAEIERATVENTPQGDMAARTAMIQQANAKLMIEPFSQQLAFFAASRSFHVLTALFQLLPKSKLKMIAVPDQQLNDGLRGTFEVIFKEPSDVLLSEVDQNKVDEEKKRLEAMGEEVDEDMLVRFMHSFDMKKKAESSRKSGNAKDRLYVSPSYASEAKFYLFSNAADGLQDKDAEAQAKFTADIPMMMQQMQGMFVPQEVAREFIRMRGYNERLLAKEQPQGLPGGGQQQGGVTPGEEEEGAQINPGAMGAEPTNPNEAAKAAAGAIGVPPLGNLAGV